jgi:large subunit ribosomal protein L29
MKIAEVRGKDLTELRVDLQSLRKELFNLRFKGAAEQVQNTSRFSQIRHDIARILTVLRERELTGGES